MSLSQVLLALLPFAMKEFDAAAVPALQAELPKLISNPIELALAMDVLVALQKAADAAAAAVV